MSLPPLRYTISGTIDGERQTASRGNPASAMCLADTWSRMGGFDIASADPQGVAHTPDQFRAKLPLRRLIAR